MTLKGSEPRRALLCLPLNRGSNKGMGRVPTRPGSSSLPSIGDQAAIAKPGGRLKGNLYPNPLSPKWGRALG